MTSGSNRIVSSAIGLVGFLGIGIVTGIVYMFVVGTVLDRGGDGFGLVGAIVTYPLLITLSGLGWLILWHLHAWKLGPMSAGRVVIGATLTGLLVALVIAGPRGFTMHGGATLFNYFLIGGMFAGALVHHGIFRLVARRGTSSPSRAPDATS